MEPLNRKNVYKILDEERNYQDSVWGGSEHDKTHSTSDWFIFIRKHMVEAENALYDSNSEKAMDAIRKITALGVAAMEAIGCPKRKEK
jgi:hypothetical protein